MLNNHKKSSATVQQSFSDFLNSDINDDIPNFSGSSVASYQLINNSVIEDDNYGANPQNRQFGRNPKENGNVPQLTSDDSLGPYVTDDNGRSTFWDEYDRPFHEYNGTGESIQEHGERRILDPNSLESAGNKQGSYNRSVSPDKPNLPVTNSRNLDNYPYFIGMPSLPPNQLMFREDQGEDSLHDSIGEGKIISPNMMTEMPPANGGYMLYNPITNEVYDGTKQVSSSASFMGQESEMGDCLDKRHFQGLGRKEKPSSTFVKLQEVNAVIDQDEKLAMSVNAHRLDVEAVLPHSSKRKGASHGMQKKGQHSNISKNSNTRNIFSNHNDSIANHHHPYHPHHSHHINDDIGQQNNQPHHNNRHIFPDINMVHNMEPSCGAGITNSDEEAIQLAISQSAMQQYYEEAAAAQHHQSHHPYLRHFQQQHPHYQLNSSSSSGGSGNNNNEQQQIHHQYYESSGNINGCASGGCGGNINISPSINAKRNSNNNRNNRKVSLYDLPEYHTGVINGVAFCSTGGSGCGSEHSTCCPEDGACSTDSYSRKKGNHSRRYGSSQMFLQPNGASQHFGHAGSVNSASKSVKRQKHVQKACIHCKKAHLACDNERPCRRCVHLGKTDCVDVEHKRRGRPKSDPSKKCLPPISSINNTAPVIGNIISTKTPADVSLFGVMANGSGGNGPIGKSQTYSNSNNLDDVLVNPIIMSNICNTIPPIFYGSNANE